MEDEALLRQQRISRGLDQLNDQASSFVSFALKWKDMEEHLAYVSSAMEERERELHSIQGSIKVRWEVVEEKVNELEKIRKCVDGCLRRAEEKEKEKEKELNGVQDLVRERLREFEDREKEFGLGQREEIEKRRKEIEWVENAGRELDGVRDLVERNLRELGEVEERLWLVDDSIDERANEVRMMESKVSERIKEIEVKEKEIELKDEELQEGLRKMKLKDGMLEEGFKELEVKKQQVEEKYLEIELREENFKERFCVLQLNEKEVELKQKEVQEGLRKIELKNSMLEDGFKELELKKQQVEEKFREIELKEENIIGTLDAKVKVEPLELDTCEDNVDVDSSTDASIWFSVKMDGQALQIFLNERCREHDSMRNEVEVALRMSPDPAKLVLGAMQGFYPPHLKKGHVEFEDLVVRRSCNLLLEQLRKVSPPIKAYVKKDAMKLAFDWMTRMRKDPEHSLEVLGFLQLLASYGLANAFDEDELLNYLEIGAGYRMAPDLLRSLGLEDKAHGIIQNLLEKKWQLEAIAFICSFELVDVFPVEPILKAYLNNSKDSARRIQRKNKSVEAQIGATNKLVDDLWAVVRCIEDHTIECGLSIEGFMKQIDYLEKENSTRKALLALHTNENNCFAPYTFAFKSAPSETLELDSPKNVAATAPDPKTSLQHEAGVKRPWTGVSPEDDSNSNSQQPTVLNADKDLLEGRKEMDGEDLRVLLNNHGNDELTRDEVFNALKHVCDPVKLVLQAIKNPHPSNLKRKNHFSLGVSLKSCLLLLEQLKRVSSQISPELKKEAKGFALYWKPQLEMRKDPLGALCFLQFLSAFGLVSLFSPDALIRLLDTADWRNTAPDLCKLLGLTDSIPDFIQKLINRGESTEAVKFIYALDMSSKFPPEELLLNDLERHAELYSKRSSRNKSKPIREQLELVNREIQAIKATATCIEKYKIESKSLSERVEEKIKYLEKEQKLLKGTPKPGIPSHTRSKSKVLNKKSEGNCDLPSAPTAASSPTVPDSSTATSSSPVCESTSATIPLSRPQKSRNKRRRIVVSSDYPTAYVDDSSIVHSMPPPVQLLPGSYTNTSRHYGFSGYRPYNTQQSSYCPGLDPYRSTFYHPDHGHPLPYPQY